MNIGVILMLAGTLGACASTAKIDMPEAPADRQWAVAQSVRHGDELQVHTASGESLTLTVETVTASEIRGDGQVVAIDDIERMDIRRPMSTRQKAIWSGVAIIAASILIELALQEDCEPSPAFFSCG